ncbi:hypothetical protein EV363DRAFT_1304556 [Boletus edulis]|nr:hypothetical protein EV363DRAFT_1304556 [Boletus edulis]
MWKANSKGDGEWKGRGHVYHKNLTISPGSAILPCEARCAGMGWVPECRNGILEIAQLPEALETSDEGVTEVVQTTRLVRVTMRREGLRLRQADSLFVAMLVGKVSVSEATIE